MDKTLLKENRAHGEISFPLNAYRIEATPDGAVLDCHWHDELEFLMLTSGKAVFQVENNYYNVHAGEAVFINSGELHAGYCLDSSPCTFDAVVFSPAMLHSGSLDIIYSKYIDPVIKNRLACKRHIDGGCRWERELLEKISKIPEYVFRKSPAYELYIKSELYGAFAILCENGVTTAAADKNGLDHFRIEKLKTALKYIQENFSQKLTTMDISTYLNMSEGHFCRLFKQYVRRTPMEYLNYYRINRAARLLEETELKVLEVAMEVGFDNLSYFIRTFKHYMGTTPSKYRNKINCG